MPVATAPTSATARTHALLGEARALLASIDDSVIASQIAISQIAAPTGHEAERARYVAAQLELHGVEASTDAIGNVVGHRPGSSDLPPVVLCAHLDTVFAQGDDLTVRHDESHLIGPGIGDNARGLAAMLAIAAVLERCAIRTERPLVFLATVGEEALGDLRGAKHYFEGVGRDTHAAVIVDGPGDERVVHRAVGSRRWRIRFTGPGGHSWSAYGLPNPLNAAGSVAAMLASIPVPVEPRTTLTVSRIVGGLSINAIPGDALVEIDLRSVSQDLIERLARETSAVVETALGEENDRRSRGTPPLACTIEMIGDRPGGETAATHELVASAAEATRLAGRIPELGAASTDANVPIALGIPAIALGAGGRGGDAHTPQEWFENADGTAGIARVLTVACHAAGLTPR